MKDHGKINICMIEKTVLLKNGSKALVRQAKSNDAKKLINYIEMVSGESDFLTIGPGEFQMSLSKEKEFIKNISKQNNSLFLLALVDQSVVAVLTFEGGSKPRTRHRGDFGITVLKDYWGLGIGSMLIGVFLDWVKATKIIKKINLLVDTGNRRAIAVYKKFGFKKEGIATRDSLTNGKYRDAYLMGLKID